MLYPLFLLSCTSYPLHLLLLLLFLTAMCYALHRAVLVLHVLVGSIVIVWLFLPFSRRSPLWKLNGLPSAPPFVAWSSSILTGRKASLHPFSVVLSALSKNGSTAFARLIPTMWAYSFLAHVLVIHCRRRRTYAWSSASSRSVPPLLRICSALLDRVLSSIICTVILTCRLRALFL